MKNTAKAIWALGAILLMVVGLASTPASARERKPRETAARNARKVIEASRKAVPKAQTQRRKTIRPRAKTPRRPVVVTGRSRPLIRPGRHDDKSRVVVRLNLGGLHPQRRWVQGYYVTRVQQVLVEPAHHEWRTQQVEIEPGHYETRHVPPVVEILYDSQGNPHRVVIEPGGTRQVWVPGLYETRKVRVWVPDRYETRQVRVWVPGHWVYNPRPLLGLRLGALIRF